jgi:thiol:disulfide interchange protein
MNQEMGPTPSANREPALPAPGVWRRARGLFARHERWIWMVAIVAVLAWRWPVLKGYYYKLADVPAPATTIEWRTNVDEALAEARSNGKRVVVDFTADWCPPCIAMKHDVWPDAEVARLVTSSYIPVLIDTDRDGATTERYGVRGIPTVLVLDGTGAVIRNGAPLTASSMVSFLATTR